MDRAGIRARVTFGHRHDVDYAGVAEVVTYHDFNVNWWMMPVPSLNGICVWPTGIAAVVGDRSAVVRIARDVPVGSCRDRVLLEHEHAHVQNARSALEAHMPRLRATLATLPADLEFPILVWTEDQAGPAVIAAVKRRMDAYLRTVRQTTEVADAALDSPASYARMEAEIARCQAIQGR